MNVPRLRSHRRRLRRSRSSLLVLLLVLVAAPGADFVTPPARSAARVIHVPADYPTIAQALEQARAGDTVQVAPGTYTEDSQTGLSVPAGVQLIGAGWQQTIVDGGGADQVIIPGPNTVIAGLTIRGSGPVIHFGAGIWITAGPVTVRDNRITGNATGIVALCFTLENCPGTILVAHNIVDRNADTGIDIALTQSLTLRGNTIVANGRHGASLGNAAIVAENNLILNNAGSGIVNTGGTIAHYTVRYNDVWGNHINYEGGEPGAGAFSADPILRDLAAADYRPRAGSPALGHGTPAGTDLGALPFVASGTAPTNLTVDGDGAASVVRWSGQAAAYSVYLGTHTHFYTQRFDAGPTTSLRLPVLLGGLTYHVAVSAVDASGEESALSPEVAFEVPPLPDATYEEGNPALVFTGAWTRRTNSLASAGTYVENTTGRATLQFAFTGDSFALLRRVGPDGGYLAVDVDALDYGMIDSHSANEGWQVPALVDHLGAGQHIVTVTAVLLDAGDRVGVDALVIPSPFVPSPVQQQALARVNEYRARAGLPLARGVQAIHMAAQSHAAYFEHNNQDPRLSGLGAHSEVPDLPGYTGEGSGNRAQYFGYPGYTGEDMHFIGDPFASVDGWMESVYHRNLIMCYRCTDLGYGLSDFVDVLNMGSVSSSSPPRRLLTTYPVAGQTDVPHLWFGAETPDPLPGKPRPVGYSISLHITQPASARLHPAPSALFPDLAPQSAPADGWDVSTADLRDSQGAVVPTYLLHEYNDPPGFLGPDVVFLIPQQPLALATTYTAHMAGTDNHDVAFDVRWSFTTEPAAGIQAGRVVPGGCGARFAWGTAGPATSWLEYGATPAYGQTVQASPATTRTYFSTTILGLSQNATYHYRIVARDDQGNQRATEDRTFVTRTSRVLRVPAEFADLDSAFGEAEVCDHVVVAAGTYHGPLIVPPGVLLSGAGSDRTTIDGQGKDGTVVHVGPGSVVEGFTITGSGSQYWDAGIWVGDESLMNGRTTIQNNVVRGNGMGIVQYCFQQPCTSAPTIRNNLVVANRASGIVAHLGQPIVVNNIVRDNSSGIIVDADGATIRNNIVVGQRSIGITASGRVSAIGYNDAWNNATDYMAQTTSGPGALSVDPRFVNADGGDYHLQPGSPLRDAGDPDLSYADLDGSRDDLGIYGGPFAILAPDLTVSGGGHADVVGTLRQVRFTFLLQNRGAPADNAVVTLALPAGTQLVEGSATTSQGTVSGTGPLVFQIGSVLRSQPVTVGYTVRLAPPAAGPMVITATGALMWQGGSMPLSATAIVDGYRINLPFVLR